MLLLFIETKSFAVIYVIFFPAIKIITIKNANTYHISLTLRTIIYKSDQSVRTQQTRWLEHFNRKEKREN